MRQFVSEISGGQTHVLNQTENLISPLPRHRLSPTPSQSIAVRSSLSCFCFREEIDPRAYRRTLAHNILEASSPMQHVCLVCAQTEFAEFKRLKGDTSPMVACNECHRWVHHLCDTTIGKKNLQEVKDGSYLCPLCTRFHKS